MDITPYSTYTDEQLLISLRNDNSQAFGAIYNRYYSVVYQYLLIIVKVPEIAEDITHEVFLKIWDSRAQIKIERTFKGYLLRTAHNKAIDATRKIATETTVLDQVLYHYKATSITESFSQDDLKRLDSLVEEALSSLTPQRRKIFEMCKKEKKSYEEIAKELNISRNTVKAHISQTLSLLRDFILERRELSLILLLIKKLL